MAQLLKIQNKKKLNIVGAMNGTSIDGCDFALCEVSKLRGSKLKIQLLQWQHVAFPKALRERLLSAASDTQTPMQEISRLHHDLGRFYAKCASKLRRNESWRIDAFAIHGQTLYHEGRRSSLQIGEVSYVSHALQTPVAFDFRSADIAMGGQGGPLAPVLHRLLAKGFGRGAYSFHNLGGISNLTFIEGEKVSGFDTGPANILIDAWMTQKSKGQRTYDRDGRMASQGLVDVDVLKSLLESSSFLRKKPPKSCGREEYGQEFLSFFASQAQSLSLADQLATLTEFTAKSIEQTYRHLLPKLPLQIFLCGGGAKNLYLISRLRFLLPEVEVLTTDALGWPVETIEAGAFALLGAKTIWELPTDLRAVTGAKSKVTLGKLCSY